MLVGVAQLRAARALIGWSQEQLAVAAGYSRKTVSQIENEKVTSAEVVRDLAKTLEANGIEFTTDGRGVGLFLRHADASRLKP